MRVFSVRSADVLHLVELECPDAFKVLVEGCHDVFIRVGADSIQDEPDLFFREVPWSCPGIMFSGGRLWGGHCCEGMGRRLEGKVFSTQILSL